ncbi:NADH-quinone oxidoreductase subunit J [Rhodoferax sp. 4810]|uniref:NADH-quinone oxidoreductase subunit J n=1 Tax=Thiospirillum jenense TaxID=1653858 RepID=A0A839HIF0_9GAMM|nr:NADH-quinone oxidoreductase subunit J [Thiospirillum jenense]MBB1074306.1 NADH-quinone oxidoreductase subunit J [Rhodoferax jenense]MBB1126489.1 NADH-quinone oxidoreductase subunit J [Thiospirillum jenense]
MGFEKLLFYIFAAVTLFAASMVITRRNPVLSALYLVMAFVSSAALWLLLEAEFLGIVLILVYVGAVMVLFLFVVMMLNIDVATLRARFIHYLPLGLIVAGIMVFDMFLVLGPADFGLDQFAKPQSQPADYNNTAALGQILYTTYLYQFEIAAVILLVAIVAAIRLTLRHRPETKYQDPSNQVRVRKGSDRVRLITMPAEPVPPSLTATLGATHTEMTE